MIIKYLLLLCIFIKIVYSANPLSSGEYLCMDTLGTITNLKAIITHNEVDDYYDYCAYINGGFHIDCSQGFVNEILIQQTSTTLVTAASINCFQKLVKFTLSDSYLDNNFFTGPLSLVSDLRIISKLSTGVTFSAVAPSVKTLRVELLEQPTTTLPFSLFSNVNDLNIGYSANDDPSIRTHLITYENDLSGVWAASDIKLVGDNLPSFKNVQGGVVVILNTGFNKTSVEENFKNIGSLNRIEFTATDLIPFPTPIGKIVSTTLKSIETTCKFLTPSDFIDLRGSGSVISYKFYSVGRQFSFNNQFPFKVDGSIYSFLYTGGTITTLDYSVFNGVIDIDLTNNSISSVIPSIPLGSTLQTVKLDHNSLTGTLDQSYCELQVSVIDNDLTGDIPSCFTCFFGYTYKGGIEVSSYFAGNSFTNLLAPPPCTTIVPNIRYSNSTLFHTFEVFGVDLGGNWIQDSITSEPASFPIIWSVVKNNKLISGESRSTDPAPRVITITYAHPPLSFILSWDPLKPQIQNVVWSNDVDLQIIGSFFTYNQTIISIDIGGRTCLVTSTTFNEILCSISSAVTGGLTNIVTYVTVGSLTTQITLTPNINNIIVNCTANHNDCNGVGICITDNGSCVCNQGRNGPSCEFFDCPIVNALVCNGIGTCNGTTGNCACPDYYTSNDCAEAPCLDPLCSGNGQCMSTNGTCSCDATHTGTSCEKDIIPCPNDCSGFGNCDKNTGICQCDNLHQSADCSIDLKSCPIYLGTQCTSQTNGLCNNVTGVCSCIGNFTGPSCRFIKCPAVNGAACNNQGACIQITGKCSCNPNYQGADCGTTFKQCPSTEDGICNGVGDCNDVIGQCTCTNPNYQGVDCSEPFVQCKSTVNGICNNQGSCNNHIGQCTCTNDYQGDDCGTTYKQCPLVDGKVCNDLGSCDNVTGTCICTDSSITNSDCFEKDCIDPLCSSNGKCNRNNGICSCYVTPNEWQGSTCSTPSQTMSSVNASTEDGGEAIFFGWFGNVHSLPSLSIGGKGCAISSINDTTIICTAPAGKGVHSVQFTQNLYTYTINNFYAYLTIVKSCPNDCTSTVNGQCNSITGYCQCIGNWGGYDCSLYRNDNTGATSTGGNFPSAPPTTITVNNTNGNTNLNNQQTNYEISIIALVEYDLTGKEIKNYPLLNHWSVTDRVLNSDNIYQFIQTIQNGGCNITFILEDIKVGRNVVFAGLEFQLTSGSIKMTVSIDNYQYSSSLNTLQLQMSSTVNEINTSNGDENNCNDKNIEINTVGDIDNQSLNYVSIKKNSKVLTGRFINRVESDGRSTYSQTTVVSRSNDTIIIGMNLPHFKTSCLIDPDFSVLISPEFVSECDNSDSNRKWVIPVAVCVSVAGVAAMVGVGILLHRRIRIERPFSNHMKKLGLLNK